MDQQTKAALKQDKFVNTTTHGLEWASEHRQSVIKNGAIALAVIVVLVVGAVIYNSRSDAASVAFGDAMQVYQTPLAQAGQEVPPGMKTFPSTAERAKAANAQVSGRCQQVRHDTEREERAIFCGPDRDRCRADPAG